MIKDFFNRKLKAGALQYAIFISVVIAMLVFAFISFTYTQERLRIKASFFKEVVHNTNEGFKYLVQGENQVFEHFKEDSQSDMILEKKVWGLFEIVTITSMRGKEAFTKKAMLGYRNVDQPALYMVEEYQPLVLVGDTIIEGDVFVSEHGVKAGSIAGYSYNKSQLIYGNIHKSTKQLPEIQTEFDINTIKVLLTDHAAVYIDPQENKTVMNSFKEPVKVIASSDPIRLQSVKLVGNILIHSESEIIVDATASLQDVVLVAPIITVHDNVHGNFQAFAEKNIRIGKGCRLNYPTALVLEEKEENIINESQEETINQISIEKGADIRGIVLFLKETATENTADYKPQIVIEEAATIHGEVYCEQNVELKGTVGGSIFTRGFIANQFGSIYKNHIFNGKILSNDLTHYYAGLFLKDAKPTVAKWIQY